MGICRPNGPVLGYPLVTGNSAKDALPPSYYSDLRKLRNKSLIAGSQRSSLPLDFIDNFRQRMESAMPRQDNELVASIRIAPLWFVAATAIGVWAWMHSASEWPALAFRLAFDVPAYIPIAVILLAALFLSGRTPWKRARHARNDVQNFGPWVIVRLQRGISVLLGVTLVTLLAWASVGSQNGARITLLCGLLAAGLQWCAYCMHCMLIANTRTTD